MSRLWKIFAVAVLAATPLSARAIVSERDEAAESVRLAADKIEAAYVDAKLASRLATRLRREAATVRVRGPIGAPLADNLTQLLRSMSNDPHFRFGYSKEAMPENVFQPRAIDESEKARRSARANNYGVLKAERLPGNIGLLDLEQFADPALMQRPLAAAMELLRHCDALIVDLRYNGGGHARGAALAASYFLPEGAPQLLVRFETRVPGESLDISTFAALDGPRFTGRPVYILTSQKTFSAAELFATSLQRLDRAKIVGSPTRGGNNPVARIWLSSHYGLLLPTARSVVPSWHSPRQIVVEPDISSSHEESLETARRAAMTALLAAQPNDMLAPVWRELLAAPPSGNSSLPETGDVR